MTDSLPPPKKKGGGEKKEKKREKGKKDKKKFCYHLSIRYITLKKIKKNLS